MINSSIQITTLIHSQAIYIKAVLGFLNFMIYLKFRWRSHLLWLRIVLPRSAMCKDGSSRHLRDKQETPSFGWEVVVSSSGWADPTVLHKLPVYMQPANLQIYFYTYGMVFVSVTQTSHVSAASKNKFPIDGAAVSKSWFWCKRRKQMAAKSKMKCMGMQQHKMFSSWYSHENI